MKTKHSMIALALILISSIQSHAQMLISTDTTQNGGTLTVTPSGTLTISDPLNDPLLTLAGGATTSGVSGLIIGNQAGEKGRLLLEDGSVLLFPGDAFLGLGPGSIGEATVTGSGTRWFNFGSLYVGSSGDGTLNVKDGGLVFGLSTYVGKDANSNGVVTVTDPGTRWQSTDLYIGYSYDLSATVMVENGGLVTSTNGYIGYGYGTTNGTVTVTGAGSQWQSTDLYVGYNSNGTLNIENGGVVTDSNGHVSYEEGIANVNVAGPGSQWKNSNTLTVGGNTDVGISKNGTLTIKDGGLVTSGTGYIGNDYGTGTVHVIGANSQWQNSGALYVGFAYAGNGTLTIENGGLVTSDTSYIGAGLYANGTVTVTGPSSQWQIKDDLYIGWTSSAPSPGTTRGGTLNIENGGLVTSATANLGGGPTHNFGSNGTVAVTGEGSQWQVVGRLSVGYDGRGTLTIENSGVVSSGDSYVGQSSGEYYSGNWGSGNGTATVRDANSQWKIDGDLYVGYGNKNTPDSRGTLNIEDGGVVTSANASIGFDSYSSSATVDGASSRWQVSQSLTVGSADNNFFSNSGTLTIKNGGVVTSSSGNIGDRYGNGQVSVSGSDSQWLISGSLAIGIDANGTGKLNVENGGTVDVGGVITLGAHGTLAGNGGTIIGDIVNHGTISPGNSPGVLMIDGDLNSTGLIDIQLAGTGSGLFDQLIVTGELTLGGIVEFDLLNGYAPIAHSSFKVLDFASFTDAGYKFDFTHATLGAGLSWDTSTFAVDGTIRVVPEASSLVMAGMGAMAGLVCSRLKSRSR